MSKPKRVNIGTSPFYEAYKQAKQRQTQLAGQREKPCSAVNLQANKSNRQRC